MARRLTELLKRESFGLYFLLPPPHYPTVQEILSALPSKYTWNLMFIHHFLHYRCCPSNNLLTGLPDFQSFQRSKLVSAFGNKRLCSYIRYQKLSLSRKSIVSYKESHSLWPLLASPTSSSFNPSSLTVSQPHGTPLPLLRWRNSSCLRAFALAGLT